MGLRYAFAATLYAMGALLAAVPGTASAQTSTAPVAQVISGASAHKLGQLSVRVTAVRYDQISKQGAHAILYVTATNISNTKVLMTPDIFDVALTVDGETRRPSGYQYATGDERNSLAPYTPKTLSPQGFAYIAYDIPLARLPKQSMILRLEEKPMVKLLGAKPVADSFSIPIFEGVLPPEALPSLPAQAVRPEGATVPPYEASASAYGPIRARVDSISYAADGGVVVRATVQNAFSGSKRIETRSFKAELLDRGGQVRADWPGVYLMRPATPNLRETGVNLGTGEVATLDLMFKLRSAAEFDGLHSFRMTYDGAANPAIVLPRYIAERPTATKAGNAAPAPGGAMPPAGGAASTAPAPVPTPSPAPAPAPAPTPVPAPAASGHVAALPASSASAASSASGSGAFTATAYMDIKVLKVTRRAAGGIEIKFGVRNKLAKRRGVPQDWQSYVVLAADGTSYPMDGNYYDGAYYNGAGSRLSTTLWLEQDEEGAFVFVFPHVPPGADLVRLVIRDGGKETASLALPQAQLP